MAAVPCRAVNYYDIDWLQLGGTAVVAAYALLVVIWAINHVLEERAAARRFRED